MDAPGIAAEARPRLAVVYGHRSLELMQIVAGARDWCELVWLVDRGDPAAARARPLLRRYGSVVDALGEPPERAAAALLPYAPEGLATFYDTGMERVANVAAALGVRFHTPETARRLEDKLHQREALRDAGLPGPRAVALPHGADRQAVERIGAELGFPAVLKPRRASGSWHMFHIADAGRLGELWERLAAGEPEALMLEEFMPGGLEMPNGFEADYVSVETVAEGGRMTHLGITGRFPLAPPFRETGFFIPASLPPGTEAEVLELAGAALRALGVSDGAAHTEIKLGTDGLRVIEVNGRVGGGVPDMLRLSSDVDIVKLTLRAALGLPSEIDSLPISRGVAYRFFYQPPASARRLRSIDGLRELGNLPGVESVSLHYPPGTEIDSGHGTRTYVFALVGWAEDQAGMLEVRRFLETRIAADYEF
jgi:biotin carboxylase